MSTFNFLDNENLTHLYVTLPKYPKEKTKKKKIIIIAGPTGVGKTSLSLEIAKILHGEIISADSMQVYKDMDIGTAKISKEKMQNIPHHLIDVADIKEDFNVVDFYNLAHLKVEEILKKEKVPILVGGSGFYIHSFLYGPPQGPPSVIEIRKHLEHTCERIGVENMYEKLEMLDPTYAKTISEKDKHKIIRALEIISITKKPVSSLPKPMHIEKDLYDCRCWFLTMPREKLYARVELRCEQMIENGFVEEVERLKNMGLTSNYSASNAIGYKQCLDFFKTNRSEEDKRYFIEEFKKATRHYIKRQFTWFKKEPLFRFLDLSKIERDRALEYIMQDYEQN